jgi:hypothetical protein
MRQVYDQTKGDHATKAAAADKVWHDSIYAKGAVIILGPEATNTTRLHELGHVNQAIDAPMVYQAQAEAAANMSDENYEKSDSEIEGSIAVRRFIRLEICIRCKVACIWIYYPTTIYCFVLISIEEQLCWLAPAVLEKEGTMGCRTWDLHPAKGIAKDRAGHNSG